MEVGGTTCTLTYLGAGAFGLLMPPPDWLWKRLITTVISPSGESGCYLNQVDLEWSWRGQYEGQVQLIVLN